MSERRVVARIDLDAVRHNARRLAAAADGAELMAVVKADGYGHGAAPVAAAALDGGATRLAVATLDEARSLRESGIAAPILILGALHGPELRDAVASGHAVTIWTPEAARAADQAARSLGLTAPVHLKFDTGMGRLGAVADAVAPLVAAVEGAGDLVVEGLMTHFATADEREGPNAGFLGEQLVRFRSLLADVAPRFPAAQVHAANSAATLREPGAVFDIVRCGIALYGCSPFGTDPADDDLRPAMSLRSWISSLKLLRSRESAGYGRLWRAPRAAWVAAVPVGYGDGYARDMRGADALVGGRRVPVVGAVSMDQITLDLGPEAEARVGDEVVLLGAQGGDRITAEELAAHRGTINYEITCALTGRVPREHHGH